jgi:hypothetical protein
MADSKERENKRTSEKERRKLITIDFFVIHRKPAGSDLFPLFFFFSRFGVRNLFDHKLRNDYIRITAAWLQF